MRRSAAFVVSAALLGALSGCGASDDETPTACLSPPKAYLAALEDAPGEVRLQEETAISDGLGASQGPGTQADVGETVIAVATELNRDALRDRGGRATVELGYLVGAVQEGAARSSGINADLVRRLDAAARFNPHPGAFGAAFERAYGKGYAAGQETG